MQPAELNYVRDGGREYADVRIREFGKFTIPRVVLGQEIKPAALEVVAVSVSADGSSWVLESQGGVVTTEWLTSSVRLSIRPRISEPDVALLLDLAAGRMDILRVPAPRQRFGGGGSLLEWLGERFLDEIEGLISGGLGVTMTDRWEVAPSVRGRIDAVASLQRLLSRRQLEFVQERRLATTDTPVNRCLRATLECLMANSDAVSAPLRQRALEGLSSFGHVPQLRSIAFAADECRALLAHDRLDPSRPHYLRAARAALPILEGAARPFDGSESADTPVVRIRMPDLFERAVRNTVSYAFGSDYWVRKDVATRLYRTSAPASFGPSVEPDVLVSPIDRGDRVIAVLDAKYKSSAAAGDHYQLSAYAAALSPELCAIVTLAEPGQPSGVRGFADLTSRTRLYEFAIQTDTIRASVEELIAWLRKRFGVIATETRYRFYWSSPTKETDRVRRDRSISSLSSGG